MKSSHPIFLYHGSAFDVDVLHPGIYYTGKEEDWDDGESNRFLYAGEDQDFVVDMALASLIDKIAPLKRFNTSGDTITLEFYHMDHGFTLDQLTGKSIYLYQIVFKNKDKWIENHDEENGAVGEWKTNHPITNIRNKTTIPGPCHLNRPQSKHSR